MKHPEKGEVTSVEEGHRHVVRETVEIFDVAVPKYWKNLWKLYTFSQERISECIADWN